MISADDGFSPPKTVEQTRRLVEVDGVFLMHASVGTATNLAVRKYLNDRKIPQLLLQSGISKFNDPRNFPWSLSGLPNYDTEVQRLRQAHPCRQAAGQGGDPLPERRFR